MARLVHVDCLVHPVPQPHLENLDRRGPKERKALKVALEHLEVKVCKVLLVFRGCPGQRETRVRRAFPEGMV